MMNFILNSQVLSMSIVVGTVSLLLLVLCNMESVHEEKTEEVKLYTENIFQER